MEEKLPLLLTLLRDRDPSRTMIFVNTRREADRLRDALVHNGIKAEALSGDVPQRKRLRMLKDFQAGELDVLIGTDVASRGLHVPGVSHVFNYDLPQDPEDYVHRIGRTARAGAAGDAISFGCETYAASLPDIEAFIGRKIPVATFDRDALVAAPHGGSEEHRRPKHSHGGGGPRPNRPPRRRGGRTGPKPRHG
jgi:ATP-dependent RNA helicase RhlB